MKQSRSLILVLGISLLFALSAPTHTVAADKYVEATESTWGYILNDDGFDKIFTIYKDANNTGITDYGDDITYTAEIQCSKKKLTFMVYSEPIGIYPSTSYTSIDGYASAKIDSGKIVKYPYVSTSDSVGIVFSSPKTVTSAILKGKKSFSFKILSPIQNNTVANFAIGDMPTYISKFKKLGCPLK
jgi:hypothetical protein